MKYEASARIPYKLYGEPCAEYEKDCKNEECVGIAPELPPHCAKCGYVREDHPEGVTE